MSECVLSGDPECLFSSPCHLSEHQLTYFCGSAPECSLGWSRAALSRARANAERAYAVVGSTADLRASLAVMERALPRFFAGAPGILDRLAPGTAAAGSRPSGRRPVFRANDGSDRKWSSRRRLNATARAELGRRMWAEVEFFQFALQLLERRARQLGVLTETGKRLPKCEQSILCRAFAKWF